jgi:hypothetical protein
MSQSMTVNGVSYPFPTTGDEDYSSKLVNWANAVSSASGSTLSIINVKAAPYSARGDNTVNDAAAIQAAIDACSASSYGGVVYFPPGEYNIRQTLVLPRNGYPTGKGVWLMGAGMTSTRITDSGYLASSTLIKWAATPTLTACTGTQITDMTIAASGDSECIQALKPTGAVVSERLVSCVFRNLYLRSKFSSVGTVTKTNFRTEGMYRCVVDNVIVDGGAVAFSMKDASHCNVSIDSGIDDSCTSFMVVDGGGSNLFPVIRSESCNGGTAFLFKGVTNANHIEILQNEGKNSLIQVDLSSVTNTTFDHVSIGNPSISSAIGIKCRAACIGNEIKAGILGGSAWSGLSGYVVQVDTYCTETFFDNMHLYQTTVADFSVSPYAGRWQCDYFVGSTPDERGSIRSAAFISLVTNPATTLDAHQFDKHGHNEALLSHTAPATITSIVNAKRAGQTYFLKCSTANVTIGNASGGGNIRISGHADQAMTEGSTMLLRFDGTTWDEVSRMIY